MSTHPIDAQGRYIQANDLTIYYQEYGSGPPLILLHGGTVTSQMWQPSVPSFAAHFRVLTPDTRGHGRTNNPLGTLSYRALADDVVAFAAALGLTQPLVFGFSDGGQIALELATRYPDFACALVVGGAFYRVTDAYFRILQEFGMNSATDVDLEVAERNYPTLVARWQTEHLRADDATYWQTLIKQVAEMWFAPFEYTAAEFSQVTAPLLVLLGDRDAFVPLEQGVEMYQMIGTAELAVLPNATHGPTTTHPGMVPVVLDFLLRHSP